MSEVYNAMGRINRLSVLCIDAYGVAVKNGFEGTVEEWLASLKGEKGEQGEKGEKGDKGDPGSGASSWNDLTDKPFGESHTGGDTLTWDGNTEGLVEVNLEMPGMLHYKVSDAVLSAADVSAESGSSIALSNGQTYSFTAADIIFDSGIGMHSAFYFISVDTSAAAMLGCETGTYLMKTPGGEAYVSSLTIHGYTGFPAVKTIDPKFLPEGYPYKETATIKGEQIDSFTVETVAKNNYDDTITYLAESGHQDSGAIPEGNVIINYDGVDYKTSRIVNNFGGMIYAHGNLSLYFPSLQDTGEPFCWFYFGGSCKLATTTPGIHTVIVRAEDEQGTIIHPLATEFLSFEDPYDVEYGIVGAYRDEEGNWKYEIDYANYYLEPADNIADATAETLLEQFNKLLATLRTYGYLRSN